MESTQSKNRHGYSLRRSGRPFTKDYKIYFERTNPHEKKSKAIPISPFHDIPLYRDEKKEIFNMVVEVPRWTNAKLEISRNKFLNPITQDILDDELRFTKNCFPYKGYIWNYATKHKGDNDPLDCCCISSGPDSIAPTGTVLHVKVLGILALIDQAETDWKLLVVDTSDAWYSKLNDVNDVKKHLPGLLDATRDWFRVYKIPDGAPANKYALDGRFESREYAMGVIKECFEQWKELVTGKEERSKDISIYNTTLKGTPGYLDPEDVDAQLPPDEELPPPDDEEASRRANLEEWFYIDRDALDDDGSEDGGEDGSRKEGKPDGVINDDLATTWDRDGQLRLALEIQQ